MDPGSSDPAAEPARSGFCFQRGEAPPLNRGGASVAFPQAGPMAVTAESGQGVNGTDGTATLWSASVDALAVGTDVAVTHDRIDLLGPPEPGQSRVIVVSAGMSATTAPPTSSTKMKPPPT